MVILFVWNASVDSMSAFDAKEIFALTATSMDMDYVATIAGTIKFGVTSVHNI